MEQLTVWVQLPPTPSNVRYLFNERNTSPRKIVEIKLSEELNLLVGDYILWTYSLMVKLTAHNGRSVVQFHLCPLVMSTDIK